MKVTFTGSEPAADHIRTFKFEAEHKPHYVAGQFIELRIPHADKDNRGDKRWFTLSSSPTEDYLTITTKLAAEHGSSFKEALQALQPGTVLDMASPMGDFVLPKDQSIPLTFVAGGIGATPFHSMVKYVQDSGEHRDITMLYAANSDGEVAFRDTFSQLGDKFQTLIGGRLSAEEILKVANKDGYMYLSGPEPMIEALQKDLRNAGVDKKHIQTDFFPNYSTL